MVDQPLMDLEDLINGQVRTPDTLRCDSRANAFNSFQTFSSTLELTLIAVIKRLHKNMTCQDTSCSDLRQATYRL